MKKNVEENNIKIYPVYLPIDINNKWKEIQAPP